LHVVHALLVDAGSAVGVVAGLLLDPVSQQLADRSRAAEDRRRAERAEARAASEPASDDDGSALEPNQAGEPAGPVRHLLPAGRSIPRMVGAGIVTGVLFGVAASRLTVHGHEASLLLVLPFWVFLAMAVTVSVTDLTHRLVPRQLLYGALACIVPLLVVVSAHLHAWRPLVDAAGAGLGAFAVFFVIWFFVPRGMGFGDVRLAGVIGVTVGYLGLLEAYLAFLVGFVLGLVFGLVLMVGSGSGRKTRIPFAPALCVGATVAILWGGTLAHHVFHVAG
jgi:leader peptidase (prepilin peptidase)/N-methyltransferase